MYRYGMRSRGFSVGCQPMEGLDFDSIKEDPTGKYWNILTYRRKLSDDEVKEYELDLIVA